MRGGKEGGRGEKEEEGGKEKRGEGRREREERGGKEGEVVKE